MVLLKRVLAEDVKNDEENNELNEENEIQLISKRK